MMKKLLLISVLIIYTFTGCFTEYVYVSTYIYKNQTSSSITVKVHYVSKDSIFVISPQESYELEFYYDGASYPPPFLFAGFDINDSIVVSNGDKQFVHKRFPLNPETNNLYQEETYTFVNEKKRHRTYEYIFTDDDFVNAEPIEN